MLPSVDFVSRHLPFLASSKIDSRTYKASIELLSTQIRRTAISNTAMVVLVGLFVWQSYPTPQAITWILAGLIFTRVRYFVACWGALLIFLYGWANPEWQIEINQIYLIVISAARLGTILWLKSWVRDKPNYPKIEAVTGALMVLSGLHWGYVALYFLDPSNPESFALLSGALLGVVSASLSGFSVRPLIWFAFSGTIFAFVIFKFLQLEYWSVAIMSAIFINAMVVLSRNLGKRIRESITQDIRNADLLEEVSQAKEDADKANLDKSLFMAATSHDLRQPLHAQSILLEILSQRLKATEHDDLLSKMRQSNEALNSLFNSLLEISQLDAGTLAVQRAHFPLKPVLQLIKSEFHEIASRKGLAVVIQLPETIVYSDEILLIRVLRNLVSNAIKFTETGEIRLECNETENHVIVTVSDTGIGIASNEQSQIFNEYTQLGNKARDRTQGIGLGLALVRRICLLLDHPVEVESVENKGSCFRLTIPVGDSSLVLASADEDQFDSIENLLVLIIDDEKPVLEAMQTLFADWSCSSSCFTHFDDAMNALQNEHFRPDLIISDYRLSGNLTGIEVIHQLRQQLKSEIPAIIISGDTDPKLLKEVQREDLFLLHKPLKIAKLRKVIQVLINGPR